MSSIECIASQSLTSGKDLFTTALCYHRFPLTPIVSPSTPSPYSALLPFTLSTSLSTPFSVAPRYSTRTALPLATRKSLSRKTPRYLLGHSGKQHLGNVAPLIIITLDTVHLFLIAAIYTIYYLYTHPTPPETPIDTANNFQTPTKEERPFEYDKQPFGTELETDWKGWDAATPDAEEVKEEEKVEEQYDNDTKSEPEPGYKYHFDKDGHIVGKSLVGWDEFGNVITQEQIDNQGPIAPPLPPPPPSN